jgi:O-methyltransferase
VTLPPTAPGAIIECGCYQGGSTAKLSLAAALVGRQLVVCDSFQGLPKPGESDLVNDKEAFECGDFASRLEAVERNVARYGNPGVVRYVAGWYQETLDQLAGMEIACVFLDVDLEESITVCLDKLWTSITPGCKVFVHDVDRVPVVRPFRNREWWAEKFGSPAPPFVGDGGGLGWQRRLLGYSVKT